METRKIKKKKEKKDIFPNVVKEKLSGFYDLSDEEIEELRDTKGTKYPEINKYGKKLFDANGNIPLSNEEKDSILPLLEQKFTEVLDILRISRNDPNSTHTPARIARMFVNELFAGRFQKPPITTVFPNRKNIDELIISKGIEVMSVCSHHWQTISGHCAIGYIPGKHILGLSKLSRIVEWFSRRGQIQEELGEQIADYIERLIHPRALGVVIKAKHYCMISRGVKGSETDSMMITSVMRGLLLHDFNLRNEFLKLTEE
ncbi:MAG: GTP cyclohydrolase I [Bacteroidetes bacterium]|nr:MAG: GTP cyclohydrolase I [Bacteroidota bacterium]